MKNNTAENRDDFEAPSVGLAGESEPPHGQVFSYASTLRMLGHVLESHRCSIFELKVENNDYLIKGKVKVLPVELPKPKPLFSVRTLFSKPPQPIAEEKKSNEIELRYSSGDILALEALVRSERKVFPEAPDPQSTSQLLRGIGCYLDKHPGGLLVSVAVEDRWVTIVTRDRAGALRQARQDMEFFYNFWVKMYLQRSGRSSELPPSDPTICAAR
jgi:hypothetical protein